MVNATDFYSEEDYYAALDERVATGGESLNEFAHNAGAIQPTRAWLLDDRDVWVANPHYTGFPVPHPESGSDEYYDGDDWAAPSMAEMPF